MFKSVSSAAAVAAVVMSFATGPARAEDDHNWSGFYLGAHVGGSWANARVRGDDGAFDEAGFERYSLDPATVIGGLHIGFNHQTGKLVFGIEADVSFGNDQDRILQVPSPDNIVQTTLGTHGTLAARLGYDAGHWMPYIKAGVAWAQFDVLAGDLLDGTANIDLTDATSTNGIRGGWTIGGGIEYALTKNWLLKGEYLYMDFRSFNSTNLDGDAFRHDFDLHSVRVGFSYKWAREHREDSLK